MLENVEFATSINNKNVPAVSFCSVLLTDPIQDGPEHQQNIFNQPTKAANLFILYGCQKMSYLNLAKTLSTIQIFFSFLNYANPTENKIFMS